jgi:hypothetical protein
LESLEKHHAKIILLSRVAMGGIFTSTFLNMIVIPALYVNYGRAEAPSRARDYPPGEEFARSGD